MKAWLSEFLFVRECFTGSTGKPLYSYHVTLEEFQALKRLLTLNLNFALYPIRGKHWSAMYCLFIAERFRRDYGNDEGDWSWEWAEKPLGCNFTQSQRSEFVTYGLESYWKRPIRRTEKGRNFIGSLFLEGGLPWPLIKSETHGFGRVIRKSLKNYHSNKASLGTTSDLIANFESDLPYTFRNLDTRGLLAGVVDQLMYLAGKYPTLKQEPHPVVYLDQTESSWKKEFPLPLNEANAESLITDWLRDASKRHEENEATKETLTGFDCIHSLLGDIKENWGLQAQLIIPTSLTIPVDISLLSSTRLEMVFYEGKALIARGSIVYGEIHEEKVLKIRLPKTPIVLDRQRHSEPLFLVLMDSGSPIHKQEFENSSIDFDNAPICFETGNDQKTLLSNASCSLRQPEVLVRLPSNADLTPAENTETKYIQSDGVHWIVIKEDTTVFLGSDKFRIRLNHPSVVQSLSLTGIPSEFDSLPHTLFLGWPTLSNKSHEGIVSEYIGGVRTNHSKNGRVGSFNYSVKNEEGDVLFRRKFGVIPSDLKIRLFSGDGYSPARIEVFGGKHYNLAIVDENIRSRKDLTQSSSIFSLLYDGKEPPSRFNLTISDAESAAPVTVRLPFPYQGARLLDANKNILETNNVILEDLIGLSISLFSVGDTQSFHLRMELVNSGIKTSVHLDYKLFKSGDAPLSVNLFAYQNDLLQMLAAVDSQDAHIKLTVESSKRRLMTLNIKRYNGYAKKDNSDVFTVYDLVTDLIASGARLSAMLLSDPKQAPVELEELTSQGVSTGRFTVTSAMYNDGPWILYPAAESKIKFRPCLFLGYPSLNDTSGKQHASSLHDAARLYHPHSNPYVIDKQIAEMGGDLDHSGWQYLDDLRRKFAHLPLSTFESWLSLSQNPSTLAVSIFRLEVDEAFSDRMRDELAIIWESIPLPTWSQAYKSFEQRLVGMGLPEFVIEGIIDNRKLILTNIVPGFEHVQHYLSSGNNAVLTSFPPAVALPIWRNILHDNYENTIWPGYLNSELSAWIEEQDLPIEVKALPLEENEDSVVYLPVFMAYVTSGKANINDLQMNSTLAELRFFIRKISDFDRAAWYRPAHALLTSYLLNKNDKD